MANSSIDLYVTDGMQISVSIPSVGKIIKLNVKKSHNVADIKEAIEQKGGIPQNQQTLMYAGQQLGEHQSLSQFGLSNGDTLHVLVCPADKSRLKLMIETLEGVPAFTQILVQTQSGGEAALKDTETP
ncbi:hypothetical protein ACP4OV_010668 [Aristida adscensionis]